MKLLTNKRYQEMVTTVYEKINEVIELKEELSEARELKNVLEILANKTGIPAPRYSTDTLVATGDYVNSFTWSSIVDIKDNFKLPDNVLVYKDDILGGKVIKQEGTKCIVIDKEGNVRYGLTKQKVDKGFTYKLVRE
jgi:predicted transcriptional regulator